MTSVAGMKKGSRQSKTKLKKACAKGVACKNETCPFHHPKPSLTARQKEAKLKALKEKHTQDAAKATYEYIEQYDALYGGVPATFDSGPAISLAVNDTTANVSDDQLGLNANVKPPKIRTKTMEGEVKICVRCKRQFTLSEGLKKFFVSKHLHLPKRCSECRAINRENRRHGLGSFDNSSKWKGYVEEYD